MNTQAQKIRLRPHHFLCTFCFQGKGYSPAFVHNYQELVAAIEANPDILIEVVEETDDICAPCPHKHDKHCEMQEKINGLDARHSKMLGIKAGDILTWNTALQKIKEHVTLPQFHQACASCQWKPLGICEKKLDDYQSLHVNPK